MGRKAAKSLPSSRSRVALALLGCVAFGTVWLRRFPTVDYPPISATGPTTLFRSGDDAHGGRREGPSLMAYRESFGFFHDVSDEDWKRRKERARNHRHQATPAHKKVTDNLEANRWYMMNYYPLFTCPDQQRVGIGGDGPKWACDPHRLALPRARSSAGGGGTPREKCLVYSIGSNGNYIFEDGLVRLLGAGTCEIHVFDLAKDFTRRNDAANKSIFFHHWGLGSSYSNAGRTAGHSFLTLQETMQKLGHANRTIDIFKIDCEKCTFPVRGRFICVSGFASCLIKLNLFICLFRRQVNGRRTRYDNNSSSF
jgi:Methyltransferase domain